MLTIASKNLIILRLQLMFKHDNYKIIIIPDLTA